MKKRTVNKLTDKIVKSIVYTMFIFATLLGASECENDLLFITKGLISAVIILLCLKYILDNK